MLHTFDVYLFCVVADQSFTDESSRTGGSSNADDEDQYGDSSMSNYVYLCLSIILTYIQGTCFNQSLRVKTNRKISNSSIYPRFRKGRFGKEREREKKENAGFTVYRKQHSFFVSLNHILVTSMHALK